MQFGAIGFELRFIGDRTNQRMVEYILGLTGEADLIDELGRHQIINGWFDAQRGQQVSLNREPTTAAALNVRFAFGSRRSMRAAMVACSVAGTLTSAASAVDTYAPGSPAQHATLC